jgi:hypothetical protein
MRSHKFSRFLVVLLLYPWLVSFESDSLERRITLMGGTGRYEYVNRDCGNNVIDHQSVGFQDVGANVEAPLSHQFALKLRGGYVGAGRSKGLFDSTSSPSAYYGGVSIKAEVPIMGFELGVVAHSSNLLLAFSKKRRCRSRFLW